MTMQFFTPLLLLLSHSLSHLPLPLSLSLSLQVAIEEMVQRVSMLDPYSKPVLAPLGIVFPFPMFCSKLDSYMKLETELSDHFTSNKGNFII